MLLAADGHAPQQEDFRYGLPEYGEIAAIACAPGLRPMAAYVPPWWRRGLHTDSTVSDSVRRECGDDPPSPTRRFPSSPPIPASLPATESPPRVDSRRPRDTRILSHPDEPTPASIPGPTPTPLGPQHGTLTFRGKASYGDLVLEYLGSNSFKVLPTEQIVRRPGSKKTAPAPVPVPVPVAATEKKGKKKGAKSASQPPVIAKQKANDKHVTQ